MMQGPSEAESRAMFDGGRAAPLPLPALGAQTLRSRFVRFVLNRLPSYRRAGGTLIYVSPDLTHARVRVKLGWRTYGQNGAIFGGALYATIDPCYVAMLQWRLGKAYVVWDKAVALEFRKPARTTLYADIRCSENELAAIRAEADASGRAEHSFKVELKDSAGEVYVSADKTLVIKRRDR
jgi:hypothetical protein